MPENNGIVAGSRLPATATTTNLEAALSYASNGLAVLPVHTIARGVCSCGSPTCSSPGKHPLTSNGLKAGTVDAAQITAWWTRSPDANVGIVTGAVSGIVALDIDLRGGLVALADVERTHGRLPTTAKTLTGSGGFHYLFRHPGREVRNSAGKLGEGIDVRGDGGYIVAPPSMHHSGNCYQWLHGLHQLTDPPKWLLELLLSERRNGTPDARAASATQIAAGKRNSTLASIAGTMRKAGMTADEIAAALIAVNERRCLPPLPANEVRAIATSIARYPADNNELEWEMLDEIKMRSIRFVDRPLLQADTFHLIVGRKGAGKGTLIAEIAARVTRGELGPKTRVLWVGSEDSAAIDLKPRLLAAGGDPTRVAVIKQWITLPDDIDTIKRIAAEIGDVGLIIIDPIGNHLAGKNSNQESDIRDAIGRLNTLADQEEAMVLGVRHLTEKDCGRGVLAAILGSSAWVQVPRVVIAVVGDNENPGITHVQVVAGNRVRHGERGRMFRIEGVRLPGLEEEVTRAAWIGDSVKDVESLLSHSAPSKSASARDLVLDILESAGEQESYTLDARIAQETGLAAKTVRNLRTELRKAGLIRPIPEKNADGEVTGWRVVRTAAPRDSGPDESKPTSGNVQIPPPDARTSCGREAEPDPSQIPMYNTSGSGVPDPGGPNRDLGASSRDQAGEDGIPW
jgi:Bifunctional DNA primase/polymerase, N-terminal/AAA domain/Primase C terminal 1 (PriCT-1)